MRSVDVADLSAGPEAYQRASRVLAMGAAQSIGFIEEAHAMQIRNLTRSPVVTVDPDQGGR
jgi:hypothetical protein